MTKKEAVKMAMEFYERAIEKDIMVAKNPRTLKILENELKEFRKHM